MKLLLVAEVEVGDCYGNDPEEVNWLLKDILLGAGAEDLILHSQEVGDSIGFVKVREVTKL